MAANWACFLNVQSQSISGYNFKPPDIVGPDLDQKSILYAVLDDLCLNYHLVHECFGNCRVDQLHESYV